MAEKEPNIGITEAGEATEATEATELRPHAHPRGLQLLMLMTSTVLTMFLIAIDQTIVATAIPRITDEFHGLDKVSWYGSAYFMSYAGFLPSWGKALQRFPLKPTFLLGLLVFELGSLLCGVAPNANVLIAGRAVAGLGCAGIVTGSYLAVSLAAAPRRRAALMGVLSTTYALAAVCGPLLGGAFTSGPSWRWCFWVNLPVGAVAAVLTLLSFRLPVRRPAPLPLLATLRQLDLAGPLLLMGALVAFILAFQYGGQTMAWRSSTVIGLLVGCVLLTAAFLAWERWQGEQAMLVGRLAGQRYVWAPGLFQFLFGATYFVVLYYLPIYFQSIDNTTPMQSGVHNLPLVVTLGVSSVTLALLLSKFGYAGIMMTTGAVVVSVACGLFYTMDQHTPARHWIGFQIFAGLAWGSVWPCALASAQSGQPTSDLPLVTALILLMQTVGGALGLSAAQCAFNNTLLKTVAARAPDIPGSLILATGSTEIRSVFTAEQLPIIIHGYLSGLKVVWALCVGLAALAVLVSFLTRWSKLFHKETRPIAEMA